jgi:hypothetical protein
VRCALTCLAVAVLLSGCGNDRTPPRDIGVIRGPGEFRAVRFSDTSLRAPVSWLKSPGEGRRLVTFSAGQAQIAVWRYPRTEPLPETRDQLHATRKALIAQVQARDPTFKLTSSRLIRRPGLRAVELVGVGTTQGVQRSVRSLHGYGHKAEVVIDAFAPTQDFPRVDEQTFRRVLDSAKLTAARR